MSGTRIGAPRDSRDSSRDSSSPFVDFDRDGDVDLFVGGRVVPWRYGLDPTSAYAIYNARELYKQVQQWTEAIPLYAAELEIEQDPARRIGLSPKWLVQRRRLHEAVTSFVERMLAEEERLLLERRVSRQHDDLRLAR